VSRKGIKVVRDVVLNHIGSEHWWMEDLPSRDWLNQWPVMTQTTYRAPTLLDPYASEWDKKRFSDGWFVPTMPDLNQRNPHLANYLIQQAIWWMEFAGLDDFRIDTYTYSDQAFCSRWCKEVREEYPQLNMFGEVWEHGVSVQGYLLTTSPPKPGLIQFALPGGFSALFCHSRSAIQGAGLDSKAFSGFTTHWPRITSTKILQKRDYAGQSRFQPVLHHCQGGF
jgi:hypothetical protein